LIQCEYCTFKGHGSAFKTHSFKHINAEKMKLIKEEEKDTRPPEISESGRVQRSAASKATKRMSAVKEDPDLLDEDLEDSDDEYMLSKDLGTKQKQKKDGGFSCLECVFDSKDKAEMEKHVLEYHADEQEPDFEDEDEVVSSEMSEKDDKADDVLDDPEAKKLRRKVGSRWKYAMLDDGESMLLPCFDIDTTILCAEKKFRADNYFQNNFAEFKLEVWFPVSSMEANEYLPLESESSVDICVNEETISLPRFGSLQHDKDKYTFFTGGPIIASDWCPSNKLNIEVLAISAARGFQDQKEDLCLIQLWNFSAPDLPHFKAGLGLTSKVNCLKWCPSLKPLDDSDKRMGILAAACTNGTVQLFTVPQDILENEGDANIFVPKPALTLKRPGDDNTIECLKLSWYRGKGHRVLAASFADGYVALWDLDSQSPLLRSDPGCLMPIHYFRAHSRHHRTTLTLSEDSNEIWPKRLVTGSTDRKVIVWDLTRFSGPNIVKESTSLAIQDLTWMSHYEPETVTAIYDDIYLWNNTRATMLDLEELSNTRGKYTFLLHNSVAWGQAYSPMLNVFIAGTSSGDVIFHVGYEDRLAKKVTRSKAPLKRGFLYRSEMNSNYHDIEYLKTYKQLREHYKDLKVNLIDQDMRDLGNLSKEDRDRLKIPGVMAQEDVRKYPLLKVNRIDFSPQMSSRAWIFTGAQSGLARLMHIAHFKQ
jgi:WD40 repeat protein